MLGLKVIPSTDKLIEAYNTLTSRGPLAAELAEWTQWSRFDPRLAEILVQSISKHWKSFDLFGIRAELLPQPWPAALGVLLENILAAKILPARDVDVFRHWAAAAMAGVEPAPNELFFFGTRKIGSLAMFRDASEASKSYTKWGYLGRELLVNKADPRGKNGRGSTLLPPAVRRRLLAELAGSRERFTVDDYQAALEYRVSRRQAEIDLQRAPGIRSIGNTRARFYRRRAVRSGL